MWDLFGIAAILGKNAVGRTSCGCGMCDEKLDIKINLGQRVDSDWLVHFVVPAKQFWEHIGYT
jgi:hypothetical protein